MNSAKLVSRLPTLKNLLNLPRISSRFAHNLKSHNITSKDQQNECNKILSEEIVKKDINWGNVRQKLVEEVSFINDKNVDAIALQFMLNAKNLEVARSYLKFLDNGVNLATLGKYFKLFYVVCDGKKLEEKDESHILSLYHNLRQNYSILDSTTCENVILALSVTKEWRKCLKLLEDMKISSKPTALASSAVVAACFRNSEAGTAWEILNFMSESGQTPTKVVYESFANWCRKCNNWELELDKFLLLHQYNNWPINKDIAEILQREISNFKSKIGFSQISNNGICSNCSSHLEQLAVTPEEFDSLKTEFFENVIVGKNIFNKSSPNELARFKDFLNKLPPVDVIIDGLNVAYAVGTKQSPKVMSNFLLSVVTHFKSQNKKTLVFGRMHMKKWPKSIMNNIADNALIFLTEDLSQDDPYLLYSALTNGLNTKVVSRDLMRGHLHLIKTHRNKVLFKKWLTQNQIQLLYVDNKGKPHFKISPPFLWMAQKNEGRWHVPVEETEDGKSWLCIGSL